MSNPATDSCPRDVGKPPVSVLGLGYMGSAMARIFIQNGHMVFLWNRSPDKATPLTALGGKACDTAEECVQASEIVISCITDSEAFGAVFKGIDSSSGAGRVLVDFTTGSPSQVSQSVELAKQRTFDAYIHGSILALPLQVGLPDTVALYSGPAKAFRGVESTLKCLGQARYLSEDPLQAGLEEVMLINVYYTMSAGFLQSMALLKRSGLWSPGLAEKFTVESVLPSLQATQESLVEIARQIDKQDYKTDGTGCRLGNHLSSLRNFIQTHQELKVAPLCLEPFADLVEKRILQGGGDEELSGLVDIL
ncbi:hypothetical protein NQ176_g2104 [Zarea fungicola]|uniref:Uncharacterized protein n=1 Tax=Zarea fungicola TaxID=93591 RepID=A0ACC1NS50_9HYPO|nr:hypothetical protein NQ176_g2104 [Lecanicillium fungicola]